MKLFVTAIGLMLVFEGLIYFGFPGYLKRMTEFMAQTEPGTLRAGGLVAIVAGLVLIYTAKQFIGAE